jgi:hypothetical protein
MLRNTNTISKSLVQPAYIIFNDLIRVRMNYPTDEFKKQFSFPLSSFRDSLRTIKYADLHGQFIRYKKPTNTLEDLNKSTARHASLITKALNAYPADIRQALATELVNRTYLDYRLELWNITSVVRARGLDTADVFGALVKDAVPYGMGMFNHKEVTVKHADLVTTFRAELADAKNPQNPKARPQDYISIDYWNGIGIKTRLPVDITNPVTPCEINIRRFNDRNGDTGFERIITLLAENKVLDLVEINPAIQQESPVINVKADPWLDSDYLAEQVKRANSELAIIPPADGTDIHYIWLYSMERNRPNYYNHRQRCDSYDDKADSKPAGQKWPYMMSVLREEYLADSGAHEFELCTLFRFEDNSLSSAIDASHRFKTASIVNMIIYGKTNINHACLELLLPLVRVKLDNKSQKYQLDNYELEDVFRYGNDPLPTYNIKWRADTVNELGFADTYIDRLLVAKYLIRLMNEVDPVQLNFNNYYHVCSWYYMNDMKYQLLDIMRETDIASRKAESALISCVCETD